MSLLRQVETSRNELGYDAWGRNKTVIDTSLFHGVFTNDVPDRLWIEGSNFAEIPGKVNATSTNGMLSLVSGGGNSGLRSKRHARYQPNRGHLYSSSVILPDPTRDGVRDFGLGDHNNGVFFRCKSDGLYALVRTTVDGVVLDDEQLITGIDSIDLSLGNVYDIQMQWRGVGDIKFFINLELVYEYKYLGTLNRLSISNPALPIGFYCQNNTEDVELLCGCVDVTSEGGTIVDRQYNSVTTGMNVNDYSANASTNGTAMLAIALPFEVNGTPYTRDSVLSAVTTFTKDEAATGIWSFRYSYGANSLALFNAIMAGSDANDSQVKYLTGGVGSNLDNLFINAVPEGLLLVAKRIELDHANVITNPDKDNSEYMVTGGDIILVSVRPDGNGKNSGCTIEFSEEI